jgi:hypothetical protein
MRYLHILCEGPTEEAVVVNVVAPHFDPLSVQVSYSIFTTSRPAGGPTFKGGLARWSKLERELRLLLRNTATTVLTTLFDYYAFPADAPGMADRPHGSPYDRARHVESAIAAAIGSPCFLPNLVLHEIEAWVLADCARLGDLMGNPRPAEELARIVHKQGGPELVNDGPATAPSKRIKRAYPEYNKVRDGPLLIADAGLDSVRRRCSHANDWLREVEARLSAD